MGAALLNQGSAELRAGSVHFLFPTLSLKKRRRSEEEEKQAQTHLDDLPRLHGQCREVPAAVDGNAFPEDGVQAAHLIPRQDAEPPTLLRGITGRHDNRGSMDTTAGHEHSSRALGWWWES